MSKQFEPTHYLLKNVATGREFKDTGWLLNDPQCTTHSLIRTIYSKKQICFKEDSLGIYKFSDWMPVNHTLKGSSATVTYKSEGLAKALGLGNLYISLSGYCPEKGVTMTTCSFKETEAYSVCARLSQKDNKILVVASAGNTARAFAKVCSENNIPVVISVPEENIDALWFEKPLNDCVKLICSPKGTDYFDAIALSDKICTSDKFFAEGGAKNVARRDGMATTVLSAAQTIGRIPDCYFQAIGSGTGTIAAWEANMRLIEDGRFGSHKMKLFPSQNIPFTPIHDAWKASSRTMLPMDDDQARIAAHEITAKVLSNRKPPYGIAGGLYDAINDAGGDIELATNRDIEEMKELFLKTEGIDIYSASAVAVKGMINTFEAGKMPRDAVAMLNITGAGEEKFKREHADHLFYLKPSIVAAASEDDVVAKVEALFQS